jgi:ABC-type branched-subunit amino acid transport system substrate-binding protein
MPATNRYSLALNDQFSRKNSSIILGLIITVGLLFAGCSSVPDKGKSRPKLPGKTVEAKSGATSTLSQDINLLKEADKAAASGDNVKAAEYHRQIIELFPLSNSAPEARTKLAEYDLSQGLVAEAIPLLEQSTRHHHPNVGRAFLLLGEAYNHQENLQQAWQAWGELAQLQLPEAIEGWQHLLEGYFTFATPESTPILLSLIPATTLSTDHARVLFRVASMQSKRQVDIIVSLQPANSPLLPQLILAQGDHAIRSGNVNLAQTLWTQATTHQQTVQEAQYRLTTPQLQQPFRVGLMLPLSGRHKHWSANLLHAAQKALADYRDVPISLFIADSSGTPEDAKIAVENLHQQGVKIILGPIGLKAAKTAAIQAVNLQLPIITLNPSGDIGLAGDQIYMNAFNPERQARIMAHYAVKEREFVRIAILAPDSSYGRLMAGAFSEEVEALDGEIVRSTFFTSDSPDFTPWIKALVHLDPDVAEKRLRKAATTIPIDPSDPLPPTKKDDLDAWADFDALFLPTQADQIRLIAPQAAFYNIRSPQVTLLGTSRWNRQSLFEGGTEYLRGAVFLDTDRQLRDQFRMAFRQIWEEDPTSIATMTYDGVAVIAQLLREQRMGGADWLKNLGSIDGFTGAAGRIHFNKDGNSQRPYQLFQFAKRGIKTLPPSNNTKQILSNSNTVIVIPIIKDETTEQ